jgi:putative transposase
MARPRYPSDLTDAEWGLFEAKLLEFRTTNRGRKPVIPKREMVDAILYRLRTGCQWRDLPHDFPDWQAVYNQFRQWRNKGVWDAVHDALCRAVRVSAGRDPEPTALIIDSQSVKADEIAEESGYDAGKKIKGIKRHAVVDVLGLLICVVVHSAAIQDRDGAKKVLSLAKSRAPRVSRVWADGGYAGKLVDWTQENTSWTLEIVKRNDPHQFKVLPKRWIVERTFGWFMKWRCLNRHHARKTVTGENDLRIVMTKYMLRRLAA